MSAYFLYQPRTGDKAIVTAASPRFRHDPLDGDGPGWVTYANGCRHVFGGVHLSYDAVGGTYWRSEAGRMAAELATGLGGLAADERGQASLWVPRSVAWRANEMMLAGRQGGPQDKKERDRNFAALVLAGAARVSFKTDRHTAGEPLIPWIVSEPTSPQQATLYVTYEGETGKLWKWRYCWTVDCDDGEGGRAFVSETVQTAPWSPATIVAPRVVVRAADVEAILTEAGIECERGEDFAEKSPGVRY